MPDQEETLTGKELVEGEQDRWPVLNTWRYNDGENIFVCAPGHITEPTPGRTEAQAYYPASHPLLLSDDEARMVMTSTVPISERELREWQALRDRLSSWAEGGS
jgi:hypothetical protein